MLLWHAGADWMRGGFARMTIFFVLSGFLATRSYQRLAAKGSHHTFRTFWMRRARRLLPTTLLGVALGVVTTEAIGSRFARNDLFGDVAATLGNVVNWRFIIQDRSYGALFERPSAFQHFWSLAVEEQCFWLLPPLLALTALVLRNRRRARGISGPAPRWRLDRQQGVLLTLAVGLAAIPFFIELSPDTVYYGTHIRAAEFIAGVVAALWLPTGAAVRGMEHRTRLFTWLGLPAVGLILVVMFTVERTQAWLYRGGLSVFAIPAVLAVGAAAVDARSVRWLLGTPFLRLPGRWALSIYALHWPLFQIIDRIWVGVPAPRLLVFKLGTAIVVGALAFYLFEQPLSFGVPGHRERWLWRPPVLWARDRVALATLGTVMTVLVVVAAMLPTPGQLVDFDAVLARRAAVPLNQPAAQPLATGTNAALVQQHALDVALFGSSGGLMLDAAGTAWFDQHPGLVQVTGDTQLGCGFITAGRRIERTPEGQEYLRRPAATCDWQQRWNEVASARPVNLAMVVPGRWDLQDWRLDGQSGLTDITDPDFADMLYGLITDAVDGLLATGVQHVLLLTVPSTGPSQDGDPGSQDGDNETARLPILNQLLEEVAAENDRVTIVPFGAWVQSLSAERRREIFPDGIHVTETTGRIVWEEFLGPELLAALAR
jgi:peptidoglycan/LPS O-acetylase OafA/YrhL